MQILKANLKMEPNIEIQMKNAKVKPKMKIDVTPLGIPWETCKLCSESGVVLLGQHLFQILSARFACMVGNILRARNCFVLCNQVVDL